MGEPLLPRRTVLRFGTTGALGLAGCALLASCGRRDPQLLASRGDLPAAWASALPSPWRLRLLESPAQVLDAARVPGGDAGLLQLSDGWATSLPAGELQPIGPSALLERLAPLARPVGRLFRAAGSPTLAFPWSFSPWVLVLRNRADLARRRTEGWNLLLDPSLRGQLVLPSSPRVTIDLVEGEAARLRRLRAQAVAQDERDGLNLLLAGEAQAAVLPRHRVVPLLRRDSRLQVVLPDSGAPLSWSLLVRPGGSQPPPPLEWLGEALESPLLPRLLAGGWVPPLGRPLLEAALAGFPPALSSLLLPPEPVLARCRSLQPLQPAERRTLQELWDSTAPTPSSAGS
jgi:putative spermidine/putrescine transport system substrate-binding protein